MSWSSLARATRRAINRNLLLSQFKPLHQNHHPFQQPICNKRCEIKKHFSTSYKVGGGSAANSNTSREQKSKKMLIYLTGVVVAMVGSSYAAVPLYRRFCQATGYGGTVQRRESVEEKIARHSKDGTVATREIAVQFNADVGDGMPWKFAPTQREAAVYFNKIQCFCFEEQRLLPGEQIDMPVFFYIDPEFETDPKMDGINNIVLSYTFFKVSEE